VLWEFKPLEDPSDSLVEVVIADDDADVGVDNSETGAVALVRAVTPIVV
jgi:hypothetical protein